MKRNVMRLLIVLSVVALTGSAFQVLAQQGAVSPQQMEMMKKMMMNRPAVMRTADASIQARKQQMASVLMAGFVILARERTGAISPPVKGYLEGQEIRSAHTEASDPKIAEILAEMTGSP